MPGGPEDRGRQTSGQVAPAVREDEVGPDDETAPLPVILPQRASGRSGLASEDGAV
jgi:hypothetical protein